MEDSSSVYIILIVQSQGNNLKHKNINKVWYIIIIIVITIFVNLFQVMLRKEHKA